jgi:parallel beta-helix repeat protein
MLGMIVIVDVTMDFTLNVKGTIRYVNMTGSDGAYTSIQDAINAADPGDTIFVYSGLYNENVVIDKSLDLVGEDVNTTVIQGWQFMDVVYVNVDWVNITGFFINNSDGPPHAAIALYNVQDCRIFNNNLSAKRGSGVYTWNSSNINISNNKFYSHDWWGIHLDSSEGNIITNNRFIEDGIYISGDQLSHYNSHDIPINNIMNGKEIYYYKDTDNIDIKGIPIGELILANCSNFDIRELNNTNTDVGIEVAFSSNITLEENNISNIKFGIYVYSSSDCNINGNYITNGTVGISLLYSPNGTVSKNHIDFSFDSGINVQYSDNAIIRDNTANENNVGLRLYPAPNALVEGNIVTFNDGYGILITGTQSTNVFVKGNTVMNNSGSGITLSSSSEGILTNNVVGGNNYGISITNFVDAIVYENYAFENTKNGIRLISATDILVYHNYIANNVESQAVDDNGNAWDNGYPSGGNYWSDYSGVDIKKGPLQNISGSDGIGDSIYTVDTFSRDYYPLMQPIDNYTALSYGWNLISLPMIQKYENLTMVLDLIDGYYDVVQWFDINDIYDHWKHYKIGKPIGNDLFNINETMGLWIYITPQQGAILLHNGTQPIQNQTISLHPGWNMVGYPSLTKYNRTIGLNNLTFNTHIDAIWTYNAATQKYKQLTESDYFEIGKGYYIHAKAVCTWAVPL